MTDDTEPLSGELVPAGHLTPAAAREYVSEPFRSARGAAIETGRRLLELRGGRLHGEWGPFVASLEFGERTARAFMQIAAHPTLGNRQYTADLPGDWTALQRLASLPAPTVEAFIADGTINPGLGQAAVGDVLRKARGLAPEDRDAWYTPPWLFDQLAVEFDVDVCAPANPEHRTCPARTYYTEADDGLTQPWHGLVWCNPPYSGAGAWLQRMAEHGNGIALTHMPFNALWMVAAVRAATSARLMQTVEFVRPNGAEERPGYGLILLTFGEQNRDLLHPVNHGYAGPVWHRSTP